MDIETLGEKHRATRAPETAGISDRDGQLPEGLVARIRAADHEEMTQLGKARILSGIAAGIYLLVVCGGTALEALLGNESPFSRQQLIGFSTLGIIFASLALAMGRKRRLLSGIDYGQPIGAFLDAAERRYRLVRGRDLLLALPLFGILVVGGWHLWLSGAERYAPDASAGPMAIVYALFLLLVSALGCFFTYRDWKRERGRLWKEMVAMKRELQQDVHG